MKPTTVEQMLDRDTNGYFREFIYSKGVTAIEAMGGDREMMKAFSDSGAPITYKQVGVSNYIDLIDFISELYCLAERPFRVQFAMKGESLIYDLKYI